MASPNFPNLSDHQGKTVSAHHSITQFFSIKKMRTLWNPVFILCFTLAAANQLLEFAGVYIWPLHTHLDDLLVLPLTLTIALAAERLYFNNPCFTLPPGYTLLALLLFCVVFEALLPLLHSKYTADVWDVLAYTAGAVLFHVGMNKPLEEKQA